VPRRKLDVEHRGPGVKQVRSARGVKRAGRHSGYSICTVSQNAPYARYGGVWEEAQGVQVSPLSPVSVFLPTADRLSTSCARTAHLYMRSRSCVSSQITTVRSDEHDANLVACGELSSARGFKGVGRRSEDTMGGTAVRKKRPGGVQVSPLDPPMSRALARGGVTFSV
jgi:hypothetical protein